MTDASTEIWGAFHSARGHGSSLSLHTWYGDTQSKKEKEKTHVKTKPTNCKFNTSTSKSERSCSWARKNVRGHKAGLKVPSICFLTEGEGHSREGTATTGWGREARKKATEGARGARSSRPWQTTARMLALGFCPEWDGAIGDFWAEKGPNLMLWIKPICSYFWEMVAGEISIDTTWPLRKLLRWSRWDTGGNLKKWTRADGKKGLNSASILKVWPTGFSSRADVSVRESTIKVMRFMAYRTRRSEFQWNKAEKAVDEADVKQSMGHPGGPIEEADVVFRAEIWAGVTDLGVMGCRWYQNLWDYEITKGLSTERKKVLEWAK